MIDFNLEKEDEHTFTLKTEVKGTNEKHSLTYTKGNDYFVMDGEEIPIYFDEFVKNTSQSNISLFASSDSTPVYVSSGSLNIGKTVTTIGAIVTIIGGGLAILSLAGVTIATGTITSIVSNWASVIGLGTLAAGYTFNGKITFDQYRTKGLFDPGMGKGKAHKLRFQDVRAIGTVKGKSMDKQLLNYGSWWFN
ncbi:hypothetical protein [Kurthia sibirica]|uniref:Uncharacterized protein n=1 Tax=Kurthia sibirica TaxID=202750 RepID=A0A2U3AIW9_9BACL|nr:hypothetical protein [Kurthia sibirica]PWI24485.1 hypothetical protein DEX24_13585 [Kurthia sibirica]GEK35331.1 hypothetical protein KSI01_28640 [Kurthia sibirica]